MLAKTEQKDLWLKEALLGPSGASARYAAKMICKQFVKGIGTKPNLP